MNEEFGHDSLVIGIASQIVNWTLFGERSSQHLQKGVWKKKVTTLVLIKASVNKEFGGGSSIN